MRTLFIIASWYIILLLHFYNRTHRFVKYLLNKLFYSTGITAWRNSGIFEIVFFVSMIPTNPMRDYVLL